jgi:hypothetical protein
VFEHLASLTWTFPADGREVAALAVYAEPVQTPDGIVYRPLGAAESGPEGVACVDDVARAVVLGLRAWEQERDARGRDLARRWLSFLPYMQGADGRFTNFILDAAGQRNMNGQTSYPGGLWWTCRALWALGAAYRVLGDESALENWLRCPLPERAQTASSAKVTGVLALAALEVLRAQPPRPLRAHFEALLEGWAADLFACMDGYLRDVPGQAQARERPTGARLAEPGEGTDPPPEAQVGLWGYHQFPALAEAGAWLGRPAYLAACAQTVERLVEPTLAAGFLYAFPGVKANQCAYCISPMMQGLAALYRATGQEHYRDLALQTYGWFTGKNDAGAVMYDPQTGRCLDGINDGHASSNCGAESAIEAGFAELERRSLERGA